MINYFRRQEELLEKAGGSQHISSDIIESDFGIYKAKKSQNKLYGITSLVLMLPLYLKVAEYSYLNHKISMYDWSLSNSRR